MRSSIAVLFLAYASVAPAFGQTPAAGDHTRVEREGEPTIINFAGDDAEMNAAIATARSRLDYFWDHLAAPQRGEEDFVLKVGFKVDSEDGAQHEHIWVDGIKRRGKSLAGRLANEPNWMKGKRLGDRVTFTEDMISDWGFIRDGKMIGSYTTRVQVKYAPPEEAEAFRKMLGENPP